MKRFVTIVLLLTAHYHHLTQESQADTTSESAVSIEVLVDRSDAVVIAEIAKKTKEDAGWGSKRNYRVVDILKSTDEVKKDQIIEAKYTRGEPSGRVMIFVRIEDDELIDPFHIISFEHPRVFTYYWFYFREESPAMKYLALDRRGYIIEHTDRLIAMVKERVQYNKTRPEDFVYRTKVICPRDWEYDDGYDIIMDITVPDDSPKDEAKNQPRREAGKRLPLESAPDVAGVLKVARLLKSQGSSKFTHAEPDDMGLGGKYEMSPCGKYLRATTDQGIFIYDIETEKPILGITPTHYGSGFSDGKKYFWWVYEWEHFIAFDLTTKKEVLRIPIPASWRKGSIGHGGQLFSANDRVIVFRKYWSYGYSDLQFRAWDVEKDLLLMYGRGQPIKVSSTGRYVISRMLVGDDYERYLYDTTTGEMVRKLVDSFKPSLFAPDDSVFVCIDDKKTSTIKVTEPHSGRLIKEINLSCNIKSIEMLDAETILVRVHQYQGVTDAIVVSTRPEDSTYQRVKYK